ncbi:MAG: glutamine-hydrolyzing carbamoyl-phosphate synthase small subunit [Hydrotalea sp.]|nr:glutamine-hydrolyzing carbamoyl-phosphate synthase small subunit [Hydrotalea sp.]
MTNEQTPALLLLADGTVFHGVAVGHDRATSGELCFNTSMTGYQEILTDPSYAGQIVNFTFPHIGIVGCNDRDNETDYARKKSATAQKISVAGAVFREIPDDEFSNWRGRQSLRTWLRDNGIPAIAGVDTRALTKKIRDNGAMMGMIISNATNVDIDQLKKDIRNQPDLTNKELASDASRTAPQVWGEGVYEKQQDKYESVAASTGDQLVVVYDYGIKNNILRLLTNLFGAVRVVNARTPAAEVLAMKPAGVLLSNGPGDPAATADYAVPIIRDLLAVPDLPIFGICLGHQLLALALGAKTKKMTLGHRGANHPVQDLASKKVLITSQNHGFVVDDETLPPEVSVTHRSLFDGSVAGIKVTGRPVFSVQFHPEASPGPQENFYLFNLFESYVIKHKREINKNVQR